jgi:hypothetical protein
MARRLTSEAGLLFLIEQSGIEQIEPAPGKKDRLKKRQFHEM